MILQSKPFKNFSLKPFNPLAFVIFWQFHQFLIDLHYRLYFLHQVFSNIFSHEEALILGQSIGAVPCCYEEMLSFLEHQILLNNITPEGLHNDQVQEAAAVVQIILAIFASRKARENPPWG